MSSPRDLPPPGRRPAPSSPRNPRRFLSGPLAWLGLLTLITVAFNIVPVFGLDALLEDDQASFHFFSYGRYDAAWQAERARASSPPVLSHRQRQADTGLPAFDACGIGAPVHGADGLALFPPAFVRMAATEAAVVRGCSHTGHSSGSERSSGLCRRFLLPVWTRPGAARGPGGNRVPAHDSRQGGAVVRVCGDALLGVLRGDGAVGVSLPSVGSGVPHVRTAQPKDPPAARRLRRAWRPRRATKRLPILGDKPTPRFT